MVIENVDCSRSLTLVHFEDERFVVVDTGVHGYNVIYYRDDLR